MFLVFGFTETVLRTTCVPLNADRHPISLTTFGRLISARDTLLLMGNRQYMAASSDVYIIKQQTIAQLDFKILEQNQRRPEYGNLKSCYSRKWTLRTLLSSQYRNTSPTYFMINRKQTVVVVFHRLLLWKTVFRRGGEVFIRNPKHITPLDGAVQVLALVLRAPSGFNIQPYECIVVTSYEAKQKLSRAMLGENQQR